MNAEKRKIEELTIDEVKLLASEGYLKSFYDKPRRLQHYVARLVIGNSLDKADEKFLLNSFDEHNLEYALCSVCYDTAEKRAKLEEILAKTDVTFKQEVYIHAAYMATKNAEIRSYFLKKIKPEEIDVRSIERTSWLLARSMNCLDKFLEILQYLKKHNKADIIEKINSDVWCSIIHNAKGKKLAKMEQIIDELISVYPVSDSGASWLSGFVSDKKAVYSKELLQKIILTNPYLFSKYTGKDGFPGRGFISLNISAQKVCLSDVGFFDSFKDAFGLDSFKAMLNGVGENKISAPVFAKMIGYILPSYKKFDKKELPNFLADCLDKAAELNIPWTSYHRQIVYNYGVPKWVFAKMRPKFAVSIEAFGPFDREMVHVLNDGTRIFDKTVIAGIVNKVGFKDDYPDNRIKEVETFYETYAFSPDILPESIKEKILSSQKAKAILASVK